MLNRRSFLITFTSLTLSSLISGCNEYNNLEVFLLQNSLPSQLITSFRKKFQNSRQLLLKPKSSLKELFTLLEIWAEKNQQDKKENQGKLPSFNKKKPPKKGNLTTIGNYWLQQAIKEELIEPISTDKIENWDILSSLFRDLVTLNLSENPQNKPEVWGIPYRWGTVMIAYRKDKFEKLGWTPKDWQDLWKEELKHKFSLLDQPREIIGLTLKKLGYSYNKETLNDVSELKTELINLNKQVKFYDSQRYLEPLILGDTWLAVGWSSDILPITKSYSNIEAIIPANGTSLWADIWVKPKNNNSPKSELIDNWLNFCLQKESANQIALFSQSASPLLLSLKESDLAKDVIKNKLIYPPKNVIKNSEFILPLPDKINQEYEQLWKQIRQIN